MEYNELNITKLPPPRTLTTSRIGYIDALRGFAIFLVVFGHVLQYAMNMADYNATVLNVFFLPIWLPLFFFVSGFVVYKPYESFGLSSYFTKIKEKTITLFIPATVFYILYCLVFGKYPFGFLQHGWSLYWFTIVLLEILIVFYSILILVRITHVPDIVVDILLVFISLFGVGWVAFLNKHGGFYSTLHISEFCKYFQFFTLGYLFNKHSVVVCKIVNNKFFRTFVIIGFLVCSLFYFNEDVQVEYPFLFHMIHDVVICYCGLFVVYIFFFSHAAFFDNDSKIASCFKFVGKRTLDIYLLHYFLIPDCTAIVPYVSSSKQALFLLVIVVCLTLVIGSLSLLFSEIIRTSDILSYLLFGVKKGNKQQIKVV